MGGLRVERTAPRSASPFVAVLVVVAAVLPALLWGPAPARAHDGTSHAAAAVAGFQDRLAIGSITEPIGVAFAPDGTAFVALKTGVVKSFDYSASTGLFEPNAASTDFADLSLPVMNYWDRGLTGIAVDPQFPTRPYVYVNYTYNRDPRDSPPVVPRWGDPALGYDDCPAPASVDPPAVGCLAMARVSRLTAERRAGSAGWTMVPGSEKELLAAACFQFPSHASGDVRVGPDGLLYASFGDGASFTTEDWGQVGNPCPGDPADQGGSLRAQDARTAGDPLGPGGAIVRMHRDNGLSPTAVADGLVAYGQRNPWRFSFRDGTSELWSSDVGGSSAEEINRVTVSSGLTAVNRGWPCYEGATGGSLRNAAWDALDKPVCEQLYAAGAAAVQPPEFSYGHDAAALPGAGCQATTSATSGVAFPASSGSYPAAAKSALYFADFARGCLWRLSMSGGQVDPASATPFVTGAGAPVSVTVGPGGDIYYVDYGLDEEGTPTENAGGVHRVEYRPANRAPVARPVVTGTAGDDPVTVTFDATDSADPEGTSLSYAWDLDGDGAHDDSTGATAQRSYGADTSVWVSLRVTDASGLVDQRSTLVRITPGNAPPAITSMRPDDGALWSVGERVELAATATDDAALTDSAYRWQVSVRHCPGGGTDCHTHPLDQMTGRTADLHAPDHEWVSYLLVKLTVTDRSGLTASRTVQLAPRPSVVRFASRPSGVPLTVAGSDRTPPHAQTFISGSAFQVAAPESAVLAGVRWVFAGWSDGGARTHSVTAAGQSLTAAYRREERRSLRAPHRVETSTRGLVVRVDRRERRAPWSKVYAWGSRVRVVAPKRQWHEGAEFRFLRWRDGGPRKRVVVTDELAVELRAVYRRVR